MNQVILDLREITGEIDKSMPICVIEQIINYCKISIELQYITIDSYLDKIKKKVNDKQFPVVYFNDDDFCEESDRKLIKRFVSNLDEEWNDESLFIAFKHMLSYYSDKDINIPKGHFTFGVKSALNPLNNNACILYSICKYYGIKTYQNTTIETMAKAVKLLTFGHNNLKNQLISSIESTSHSDLINLYLSGNIITNEDLNCSNMKIRNTDKNKSFSRKETLDINTSFDRLFVSKNMITRINPLTHEEAIIICAYRFGINIIEAANPLEQFYYMVSQSFDGTINTSYLPVYDEEFLEKYTKNPAWYNIRITWEPLLNKMYNEDILKKFAELEGYEKETISSLSLLENSRNKRNVYKGKHPYCVANETIVYKNSINDVDTELLLCFGIINTKSLYYVTVVELIDHLTNTKMLIDPIDKTPYDNVTINKMKLICDTTMKKTINQNGYIYTEYKKLLDTINHMLYSNSLLTDRIRNFVLLVSKTTDEDKESIKVFFEVFKNMIYYMRGWKLNERENDIPKLLTDMNIDRDKVMIQEFILNIYLPLFWVKFEAMPEDIKKQFKLLNLIKITDSNVATKTIFGSNFNKNLVIDYDETILNVVNELKNYTNPKVCIRTDSNNLLSSYIFLSELCGFKTDIKLNEIVYIN